MYLKIFCLLIFSVYYCFCEELPFYQSLDNMGIKGKVKSIIEKETTVKGSRHDLIRKNVTSESKYEVISEDLVLIKKYNYLGVTSRFKYNSNHKVIEVTNTYSKNNNPAGQTKYYYDKNEILQYELVYSRSGKLTDSIVFFYDNNNHSTIKKHFDTSGFNFRTEEIWLNSKEKEIKKIQIIGNDNTRIIYNYDSTNVLLQEEKWYLNEKLVHIILFEYNENGFLEKKIEKDEKGIVSNISTYEYDIISGLVISIKSGENITSFEYNFDHNNNWIVKYEFFDDYPVKIIEREIEYYK